MPHTPADPMPILSLEQILAARERIRPHIQRTPLLESVFLNNLLKARILFKAEVLQKTGAFKYRGAANFLAQLGQSEQARGVVPIHPATMPRRWRQRPRYLAYRPLL